MLVSVERLVNVEVIIIAIVLLKVIQLTCSALYTACTSVQIIKTVNNFTNWLFKDKT